MPAIQPARLRIQIAALVEHYEQPDIFLNELHNLLGFYANRTQRPGETGRIRYLTPAYDPPSPMLRQLHLQLISHAQVDPQSTLILCDVLWEENWVELKTVAAFLLGQIDPTDAVPIFQRLNSWLSTSLEDRLAADVAELGSFRLRQNSPKLIIDWITESLNQDSTKSKKVAIQLLSNLALHPDYENLPAIFRIFQSLIRKSQPDVRHEILILLLALIERSPNEAAFLLRQNLETSNNPDTGWFIRQTIQNFPPPLRNSLQEAARQK